MSARFEGQIDYGSEKLYSLKGGQYDLKKDHNPETDLYDSCASMCVTVVTLPRDATRDFARKVARKVLRQFSVTKK